MKGRRAFLKNMLRIAAGSAVGGGVAYLYLKKKVRVQPCGVELASCGECPVHDGCRLKKE